MQNIRPLLSIGMIVKNEMRCLKRCLDALEPLRRAIPCELVIADTGSTDGTRELAQQYADICFDFEWVDDFAAARNAVLDRCSGAWHLQVDADEYLDEDISELAEFLQGNLSEKYAVGLLPIRNYSTHEMLLGDYNEFFAWRLFRITPNVRYSGSVHEICRFPDMKTLRGYLLKRIILHHDGYTIDIQEKKKRRNFPLLEKEVERNPSDLRLARQCLESCYTRNQKYKYTVLNLKLVEKALPGSSKEIRYDCMAIYHSVLTRTVDDNFPEYSTWAKRAKELFPDSILISIGGTFCYAFYLFRQEEYSSCLNEVYAYFEAVKRHERGDYDIMEKQITPILGVNPLEQQRMRMLLAQCLIRAERWHELADALSDLDLSKPGDVTLQTNYLNGLLKLWQNYEPDTEWLLMRIMQHLSGEDKREDYESFLKICRSAFIKTKDENTDVFAITREPWRLFATLGADCDLGRFALLMDAVESAEAEKLLNDIERLDLIPKDALEHALSLGAALPERFFRMKSEDIAAQASALAKLMTDEPDKAMKLCPEGAEGDLGKAVFSYNFACELAGSVDWEKHGSLPLFEFFCNNSEEYISLFYNVKLLNSENTYALPILTRFAWYAIEARKALYAGDELGFVRNLRSGLSTCPGMKAMVSYLTDKVKTMLDKPKATPEMMALAAQIRALLSQYPEDDPAVQYLKNSEEYKLVAHLIEG